MNLLEKHSKFFRQFSFGVCGHEFKEKPIGFVFILLFPGIFSSLRAANKRQIT